MEYSDKKYKDILDGVYAPLCKLIIDLGLNEDIKKLGTNSIEQFIHEAEIILVEHFSIVPTKIYLKFKNLKMRMQEMNSKNSRNDAEKNKLDQTFMIRTF